MADVASNAAGEGLMQQTGERLPFEVADLRKAGSEPGRLQLVLDLEYRGSVFLTQLQPTGRIQLELFDHQRHRWAQGNGSMSRLPPSRSRRLDGFDLLAPPRVVGVVGDQRPDLVGRARDLDRLFDPHPGPHDFTIHPSRQPEPVEPRTRGGSTQLGPAFVRSQYCMRT